MFLVESFITAINDEIKAIEKGRATKNIVLKNGEFVEKTQQGYIYQFEIDKKFPFIDDTPAELVVGNKSYKAILVQAKEFAIIVSLKDELRENIPFAYIKIDTTNIWKKLIDALTSLNNNPQFNKNLAEKAFNLLPAKCLHGNCVTSFIDSKGYALDPYQNEAVEYAIQSEVQFVHGPPGTGKTKTLAALIKEVVFNGGKVLVACHTNNAADNVIKTLIHYKHDGFIDSLFNNC